MQKKIDVGDANTMRYKKECHEHLKANGKVKTKEKDTVSYQSGNDLIIRPAKFTDNTAVLTVVNLLVGAAIGIAVVCFLIVPGIRKNAIQTRHPSWSKQMKPLQPESRA